MAAGALALGVYLATLAPDLAVGHDSGEFTTAAAVLGIPHPPGYPLYPILGHLFAWLPLGSVAFRLNLMSALLAAAAVGLSTFAAARLWGRPWAAASGCLLAGFTVSFWSQAVAAEKYALHLFLLGLGLACAAAGSRWVALALGLALSYHYTALMAVPGLAWLAWEKGRRFSWGLFALGLAPLLYLPLRASQHPPLNWGDPSSFERLVWVLSRQGYGNAQVYAAGATGTPLGGLGDYLLTLMTDQFPLGLVGLGVFGLAVGWRERSVQGVALAWLLSGPFLALLAGTPADVAYAEIFSRIYAGSFLFFGLLIAFGLTRLPVKVSVGLGIVGLVAVLAVNGPRVSLAGQYHSPDTTTAVLARLPEGAVVLAASDVSAGALMYHTVVLGLRPDVTVVYPGLLGSEWYRRTLPGPLAQAAPGGLPAVALAARDRLYSEDVRAELPGFWVPRGLVYQYLPPEEPIPERAPVDADTFRFLEGRERRGDYRLREGRPVTEQYLIHRWANAYRTVAESLPGAEAVVAARRVVEMDPSRASDWEVLARALAATGDEAGARKALEQATLRKASP